MSRADAVRNFGILPANQPLPVGKVRSELKTMQTIGQFVMTGIFVGGFALGGTIFIAVAIFAPVVMLTRIECVGIGIVLFSGAALILHLLSSDNQWVELDGDIIRAKSLYTRKITERRVQDINDVLTEVLAVRTLGTRLVEGIQGRIRGYAVRFHDLPKGIKVVRPEMTNVGEFVAAVLAKMSEHGELAPEIITMEGKPLVRRVTWASKLEQAKAVQPMISKR